MRFFLLLTLSFLSFQGLSHTDLYAQVPASVLDLSHFKLTLPTDQQKSGKADEIDGEELQTYVNDRLFFVDPDGDGVVFRATCGGATTKGSSYPRCELREMKNGEGERAEWSSGDAGTHEMTLKLKITKTPPVKKHVVCAQIHDAEDDVLMVRLEGEKLFVERNKSEEVMLDRKYKLGTMFDLKIQAGQGNISVWYNGKQAMNWKHSTDGCYFKAGCYTQSSEKKGDKAESFGEVVIKQLQIRYADQ
ncbi:Alginate lyase precursor [Rubripirellula tenax]|uniref:Alginate lyase n=1 Tax=Rubripirellula tenax TaxID=2528015 RepID=A0A5C6EEF9_9BACT|nr:polysaccharide lyase family 7 protein [Rubripirellula tenax]TWU46111.1 Alginate lyase precursor [Rubripirellula tenax]